MIGNRTMKKIAPFLVVVGIFTAMVIPLALHTINELTPYLNLTSVMAMPEAIEVDSIEIVDRKYDKTAEERLLSVSNTEINTIHPIYEIDGIFLQSEYGLEHPTNYYNRRVKIHDNSIDLSNAPLPGSGQIPIVVEYTIKEWTSVTWHYGLRLDNRGDNDIIFPAANVTVNYLDERLGEGWIAHPYEVRAHRSEIIEIYIRMENNRLTSSYINAMFLGLPLELTGIMETYILLEDTNGGPLLPIKSSQEFDLVIPAVKRGPPPFIYSLTRGDVSAYKDVEIIITALDEGTGINDYRSYIYYSIDNGISWERAQLTGPPWDNIFKGKWLYNDYPISSTFSPQTYSAEIPGFPGGTHVLFYVYLEDYADNIDHEKPGNWATSQTYSYVVPSYGALSSFSVEFEENSEDLIREKFFNWLDENGFNQDHFLYVNDIQFISTISLNQLYPVIQMLEDLSDLLYSKDVDSSYVVKTFLAGDSDFAGRVMADSGVAPSYLLIAFGIDLDDLFTYILDHINIPTNDELNYLGQQRLDEIFIIDDLEGSLTAEWISISPGNVSEDTGNIIWINSEPIGTRSLKWDPSEPSILIRNKNLNYVIEIEDEDILTFYLKYDNYTRLNEKISFNFVDNLGRKMRSYPIEFMDTGSFQEIPIPINHQNFRIDSGFDFKAVNNIEFEYSGTEQINVWIDYLSIYSRDAYSSHRYFTYDLQITNERIDYFLDTKFLSALFYEDILNEANWRPNLKRTSYWNFLDLIATSKIFVNDWSEEEFNQHGTAANLLLEWWGVQKHFEALCSLIGAEIEELEPAIKDEDIYPYAQKFAMTVIYLSLGFIASLASIKRIGRYQTIKKIEKIRKKYQKKYEKNGRAFALPNF